MSSPKVEGFHSILADMLELLRVTLKLKNSGPFSLASNAALCPEKFGLGLIERMDRLSRPNMSQAVAQEHHQLKVLGAFCPFIQIQVDNILLGMD